MAGSICLAEYIQADLHQDVYKRQTKSKLPDGIPGLVRDAKKAGVKFGIWIEPEMVNPKSELFERCV